MADVFVLVSRPDLAATNDLFEAACKARGLELVLLEPGAASNTALPREPRRLIYRAATDHAARLVEILVARPGDALLHDPHFICAHPGLVLRQNGLPVARTVYQPHRDRAGLAAQADWLGGFPVVVKRPGTEGGEGVSRAWDVDDLVRQMDGAPGGTTIEGYVKHRRCWRLTVLGGRVLAATASIAAEGDFRTNAEGSQVDPDAKLPDGATQIAIDAVAALRLEFGGVDLMERPDGTQTLAEVNFPCYFAQQQAWTGTDIAGAIVDHLAFAPTQATA